MVLNQVLKVQANVTCVPLDTSVTQLQLLIFLKHCAILGMHVLPLPTLEIPGKSFLAKTKIVIAQVARQMQMVTLVRRGNIQTLELAMKSIQFVPTVHQVKSVTTII